MGMLNTVLMLLAVPQAQAAPPTTPTAPAAPAAPAGDARRLDQVAWLGRMLYTFDRAAWVSTDALLAKVSKDKLAGVGGYVVEPGEGEVLHVTYYMGTGDAARAFFVADVRGGKVTASTMLAAPTPLTPAQAMLARARDVAAKAAVERGYQAVYVGAVQHGGAAAGQGRADRSLSADPAKGCTALSDRGPFPGRGRAGRRGAGEAAVQRQLPIGTAGEAAQGGRAGGVDGELPVGADTVGTPCLCVVQSGIAAGGRHVRQFGLAGGR